MLHRRLSHSHSFVFVHAIATTRAFEKLTALKWGVAKLEYRAVPCDHKPDKEASISNPSKGIPEYPPKGEYCYFA